VTELKLIKSYRVIGVQHEEQGLSRLLRFLHIGAPAHELTASKSSGGIVINDTFQVDPNQPSKLKGVKVGVELSPSELELIQKNVRLRHFPKKNQPDFFWSIVADYANHQGLKLIGIDNHRMKEFYEDAMQEVKKLKSLGKHDEAQAL